ncbi:hypothetical protein, partial [Micromonospora avicenniae]|uniref:hypothetical protein n=1 Tax=Micromonospora avicenniae TaxID=1198245 RepID=UPI00332BAF05
VSTSECECIFLTCQHGTHRRYTVSHEELSIIHYLGRLNRQVADGLSRQQEALDRLARELGYPVEVYREEGTPEGPEASDRG